MKSLGFEGKFLQPGRHDHRGASLWSGWVAGRRRPGRPRGGAASPKVPTRKTVGTMGSNEEKRRKHVIFYRDFIICWDSMVISAAEVVI